MPAPPPPTLSVGPQLTLVGLCQLIRVRNNMALRQQIENERGGRPLVTLIMRDGVQLAPALIAPLYEVLKARGKVAALDLWLHTLGGQTEVPWQVVSLIREFCDKFTVLVPREARSAGTHIALGADSLILGPLSTLGPVDPTTAHPLMPRDPKGQTIPVSVEDLKHCIRFIASQLKAQHVEGQPPQFYSPSDMTTIVGHLFDHIDPLAIGAVERAYELSRMITRRVLETHLDPITDKEKIDRIVDKIGGGFYSHHFPLTKRDIEKDLQLTVEDLPVTTWQAVDAAQSGYAQALGHTVNALDQKTAKPKVQFSLWGFIESGAERRVFVHAATPESKPGAEDGQQVQVWVRVAAAPDDQSQPFDFKLP